MVGMILDVFPSYKDKDMVDLLYQFERATGSSLNILVEKYLEQLLYKEGYLTVNIENEETSTIIPSVKTKPKFRKKKHGHGMVQIWCDDLYFGYVKEENYSERVNELMQFSYEDLRDISKNNLDDNFGNYTRFLRIKLKNPHLSVRDCLNMSRFSINWRNDGSWQIRHNKFSICSGNDTFQFNKITEFLYNLSDDEVEVLKQELQDCKHRRNYILEKIGGE